LNTQRDFRPSAYSLLSNYYGPDSLAGRPSLSLNLRIYSGTFPVAFNLQLRHLGFLVESDFLDLLTCFEILFNILVNGCNSDSTNYSNVRVDLTKNQ
jgi:hypothetical protein